MSLVSFLGAIELGLIYALVGLGVYLSFRVLNFPDLTVDGSFPLGAAVAATLIVGGLDPYLASGVAFASGALAGLVTAFLNLRLKILHLLASILTMIALYSINLRIMGRPNVALISEPTVLTPFEDLGLDGLLVRPVFCGLVVVLAALAVARFLNADYGLGLRATGANPRMARALGVKTAAATYCGMALSNALVALGGALFAQTNGFADISMGTGTIVIGLAAVIAGEALVPGRGVGRAVVACVVGALVYRLAVAAALDVEFLGLESSDLNLVTAVVVTLALLVPGSRNPFKVLLQRRRAP